jgi:hypothetical protein
MSYFSGALGTQAVLSSRIAPLTALPPLSTSVTLVIVPPLTFMPISVLTGRSFFLSAGVMLNANGTGGAAGDGVAAACLLPASTKAGAFLVSPPQAVRVRASAPATVAARSVRVAA